MAGEIPVVGRTLERDRIVSGLWARPPAAFAGWAGAVVDPIDVARLTTAAVEEFAAYVLGGPLAGAAVRGLWDASAGNALYLRELLRGATESGALTDDGGVWMLRRPLTAPDRLVELI